MYNYNARYLTHLLKVRMLIRITTKQQCLSYMMFALVRDGAALYNPAKHTYTHNTQHTQASMDDMQCIIMTCMSFI